MTIVHTDPSFLMHYGVLGQKWGVRRFQNEDGSLTEEGKRWYGTNKRRTERRLEKYGASIKGQQKLVSQNRGFKRDLKEIESEYKNLKENTTDSRDLRQLKKDYKATVLEARTSAASALLRNQNERTNEAVQSYTKMQAFFKQLKYGSFGALAYTSARANGDSRAEAKAKAVLAQKSHERLPENLVVKVS